MSAFELKSEFDPAGDQPAAIETLCRLLRAGRKHNVLLGVTGSGKTFTMAHVIARINRPTLVIAPNKTLAAQLYSEFRQAFPANAVEYFVSYYDYYQPEAYHAFGAFAARRTGGGERVLHLRPGGPRRLSVHARGDRGRCQLRP